MFLPSAVAEGIAAHRGWKHKCPNLRLERPRYEHPDDPTQELPPAHDYGYLSYQRHVILGLEEVARLVDVVGDELGTCGLTTRYIL